MGALDTLPAVIYQATAENLIWGWNVTNYLTAFGDTSASDPVVTMTDITTPAQAGEPITLPSPSLSANVISQLISGDLLAAGHTYQLVVGFTSLPSTNQPAMRTVLQCPF